MKTRSIQLQTSVCQICDYIITRHLTSPRISPRIVRYSDSSNYLPNARRTFAKRSHTTLNQSATKGKQIEFTQARHRDIKPSLPLEGQHQRLIDKDIKNAMDVRDKILTSTTIPSEDEVSADLTYLEKVAENLVESPDHFLGSEDKSAMSALLSVDEPSLTKPNPKVPAFSPTVQKYIDQLSDIAFSILLHPTIFITPKVLQKYVDLQSYLRKPDTLPQVFSLYASKPVPIEGSSPIKYMKQHPNRVSSAIPSDVADRGLQIAIKTKQLIAAMDIVDSSYATKAFRRNKFFRRGLFPATGLAVAPVAAYAVASQLSAYQSTMDPDVATNVAFAGILAYMGFTATIGVVAMTTANDQMDRVTWALGMPLRERWIREDERAAIDRMAGAWGFRETWRRGEEEGLEWDALREWIGRKGMILDRVELMEGME